MKTLFPAVAVLVCLVASPARCQNVANSLMVHGQETIDGSKHPELVPDALAYHLVLVHYANLVASADKYQVAALLSPMNLSQSDRTALVGILRQYKTEHDSAVKALSAGSDYRSTRDMRASTAKSDIQNKLSVAGAERFAAYVEQLKAHMQVPKQ
jgi:hypothetical protein